MDIFWVSSRKYNLLYYALTRGPWIFIGYKNDFQKVVESLNLYAFFFLVYLSKDMNP